METFRTVTETFSQWTIPFVMLVIIFWAAAKKVPMYESFVTGAKEGFDVAVMIIPYLVAILFIVFDLEIAFIIPWAIILDNLALSGFIAMAIFLAELLVGLVYAWKKGALEWE